MIARVVFIVLVLLAFPASALATPNQSEKAPANNALPRIQIAKDGRSFITQDGKPFVPFGINYYRPGTGWAPQVWKQFDAEAVRKDFAIMKESGVNCVRVFLTYGSFYQQPGALEKDGLQKFDQFLDMAERAGIYVHPTGPDHWEGVPDWARTDRYADETNLKASEDFWKLFAARYRGRTTIFAYDLLNEPTIGWNNPVMRAKWNQWLQQHYAAPNNAADAWGVEPDAVDWGKVAVPDARESSPKKILLDYQRFREDVADDWTRRQVAAIKAVDPDALVTVGLIQWSVPALLPVLSSYAAFRPERQAKFLDFLEIHFYPLDRGFYEYDAPGGTHNLAYLESIVREVAVAGKPVVIAEFGWYGGGKLSINQGRHPPATESDQARWCGRLIETTSGLAVGWLNWGFYDQPEARDVSQLTGLLTSTGKVKEWGAQFKELANQNAGKFIPSKKLGPRPILDWDACITSIADGNEFREKYYQAFQEDSGN